MLVTKKILCLSALAVGSMRVWLCVNPTSIPPSSLPTLHTLTSLAWTAAHSRHQTNVHFHFYFFAIDMLLETWQFCLFFIWFLGRKQSPFLFCLCLQKMSLWVLILRPHRYFLSSWSLSLISARVSLPKMWQGERRSVSHIANKYRV